ncbi:MAG TPA: ThuA domain-containing protein [Pirellulales bacterium]|jgi:type 1 glutamine amidotransferase|nr:ThuA domain-containing protein [Pirellulales bacterium]
MKRSLRIMVLVAAWCSGAAAAEPATPTGPVLIVVGPSTHPPGTHEVAAGARLMKHCVEHAENLPGMRAEVSEGWPTDDRLLDDAATIVFTGDIFPPARLPNKDATMARLGRMMDRGCGIVCVHYATGLGANDVPEDGQHPLLDWMGGYFATHCKHHQSVAKVFDATISPAEGDHPVLRGWKTFSLRDEPYYNNYFGSGGMKPGVVALATSMLPPDAPKREVVAWSVTRSDGGRGMGIVMPHFFKSWRNDDLRRSIMNGIVWTAGREVPNEGVQTTLPDLTAFEPGSIEPQPRPAKRN